MSMESTLAIRAHFHGKTPTSAQVLTLNRRSAMTMLNLLENEDLYVALAAHSRSPEIPESADVYGWLIGSWELDVLRYWAVDVAARHIKGEAHFKWVLEGRAVQDVWIMPRRADRTGKLDQNMN